MLLSFIRAFSLKQTQSANTDNTCQIGALRLQRRGSTGVKTLTQHKSTRFPRDWKGEAGRISLLLSPSTSNTTAPTHLQIKRAQQGRGNRKVETPKLIAWPSSLSSLRNAIQKYNGLRSFSTQPKIRKLLPRFQTLSTSCHLQHGCQPPPPAPPKLRITQSLAPSPTAIYRCLRWPRLYVPLPPTPSPMPPQAGLTLPGA